MLFTVDKYYNRVNMINIYLQCSHDKAVNNGEQVKRRDQKYCNLTIFLHNLGLKYPMAEDIMP